MVCYEPLPPRGCETVSLTINPTLSYSAHGVGEDVQNLVLSEPCLLVPSSPLVQVDDRRRELVSSAPEREADVVDDTGYHSTQQRLGFSRRLMHLSNCNCKCTGDLRVRKGCCGHSPHFLPVSVWKGRTSC
jgi:hypothetical protein